MARLKLDKIDLKILRNLQDNGRMTNVELAKRAGISPPPCLRRVRALEETGCIRGYRAELDAESLGFGVTVFAHVGLHSQAETDLIAFEKRVEGWPEVRECHMLAGETDFLLKIVAEDDEVGASVQVLQNQPGLGGPAGLNLSFGEPLAFALPADATWVTATELNGDFFNDLVMSTQADGFQEIGRAHV